MGWRLNLPEPNPEVIWTIHFLSVRNLSWVFDTLKPWEMTYIVGTPPPPLSKGG